MPPRFTARQHTGRFDLPGGDTVFHRLQTILAEVHFRAALGPRPNGGPLHLRCLTRFGINIGCCLLELYVAEPSGAAPVHAAVRAYCGPSSRASGNPIPARHAPHRLVDQHFRQSSVRPCEARREPVVDVRAQRVCSGTLPDRVSSERAISRRSGGRHPQPDPWAPEAHRALDRLLHRTAERRAVPARRHRFRHKLRAQFRTEHLVNVDQEFTTRQPFSSNRSLSTSAPRGVTSPARRMNVHFRLPARPLDVDARHAGIVQAPLDVVPKLQILVQQVRIVLSCVPDRTPGAYHRRKPNGCTF